MMWLTWNAVFSVEERSIDCKHHMTLAMDVDWSRKKLVTASWDYNVDMWDLQTGWAWGLSYWRRNKWEMFEMFEQFAGDLMGKYCDRICLRSQGESVKNHALEAVV